MELNELISIEEKIEMGFIALAKMEARGLINSLEYEEVFKAIVNLDNEEKRLCNKLTSEEIRTFRKIVLKNCSKVESSLALGHMVNASYHRLLNIFNFLFGSDAFDYAAYLRYDLNQIVFSFLDVLINNDAYEDIREDLIFYKYNLIFMNPFSGEDFLKTKNITTISIESKNYRNDSNPDLIFVDKAMLILEGREHVDSIVKFGDEIKDSASSFALVLISILELIARLILSENDILSFLQQDFNYLLESDSVSFEVKNLINDMIGLLEEIKAKIEVAR